MWWCCVGYCYYTVAQEDLLDQSVTRLYCETETLASDLQHCLEDMTLLYYISVMMNFTYVKLLEINLQFPRYEHKCFNYFNDSVSSTSNATFKIAFLLD